MPRLFKSVDLVDGKTTICFKNAAGELHRENGPAMIVLFGNTSKYTYYINGAICRRRKNGIDQPAYIVADGTMFAYQFYNNGVVNFNREGGNLPYYVRKSRDFPSYGLRYEDYCIIQNQCYKGILINNRYIPLYHCHNVDTYRLDLGRGIREFGADRGEVLIPPEKAHDKIGRVIMQDAAYLPLSYHF